MTVTRGGGSSEHDSVASLESCDTESVEEPDLVERERHLAECTADAADADLSLAFHNVRDRVNDKTCVQENNFLGVHGV